MPDPADNNNVCEDILRTRVMPLLDEVLDGYLIVGYHTGSDGCRTRAIIINDSRDLAVMDGLRPIVRLGEQWASRGL